MAIPSGQLLLVGGHDVSKDATNFGLTLDSPAQVVTGLFHDKVQRDQVAAEDSTFELSGFFRPGVTSGLFSLPGDRDRVSRVYGKTAGVRAHAFGGAIIPMRSFETPVGQRVMWKGAGEVDGEGIADAFMLYRHPEALSTLAAGNHTFYSGSGAQRADIGASTTNRTIQLIAHITEDMAAAGSRLEIFHSATAAGTYADIGSGPDITTGYNQRGGFVGATFTGVVRRYVGVRLNLASSAVLRMVTGNVRRTGADARGYWLGSQTGNLQHGGTTFPVWPGAGIVATDAQLDFYVASTHSLVTPLPSPDQILIRYRELGTIPWSTTTCAFVAVASGQRHYRSTTVTGIVFDEGTTYEIAARRAGEAANHTLQDGSSQFPGTVLLTVA